MQGRRRIVLLEFDANHIITNAKKKDIMDVINQQMSFGNKGMINRVPGVRGERKREVNVSFQ